MPEGAKGKGKLKPPLEQLNSDPMKTAQASDLARAALVSQLSRSPYLLINTTGEPTAYSGVQPEPAKTALIRAKIKYSENIFEDNEKLPYVVVIKNNNVPLEQKLLVAAGTMGVEKMGGGFEQDTAYVEQVAAMEIEFGLLRKSDDIPCGQLREGMQSL